MKRPIAVDLFAGAGGFSLGVEQAGFDVSVAVEIDPTHAATHTRNLARAGHSTLTAPVESVTGGLIDFLLKGQPVDLLVGGPPCQGYSVGGSQQLNDPRGALIREFVRLVAEVRPKFFAMENVKGLAGDRFRPILTETVLKLRALGYFVPPAEVLNAKNYGVPQHRERLFIIGSQIGLSEARYPSPAFDPALTVSAALSDIPDISEVDSQGGLKYSKELCLRGLSNFAAEMRSRSDGCFHSGYARANPGVLYNCQPTKHSPAVVQRFKATRQGEREPISRKHRLNPQGIAPTLRAGTGSRKGRHTAPRPIHPQYHRCITVREMARLSGFPDWFRFHDDIYNGARQIGNAVPPPLARAIALELFKSLRETTTNG